jgi:hypothetical protein
MLQDSSYYVYVLFDWMGIPRYVGLGKSKYRERHHWINSDSSNPGKNEFIERTWKMLGEIPHVRVREGLTKIEAEETEIALIKTIGRQDIGTGLLVNLTAGGKSVSRAASINGGKAAVTIMNASMTKENLSEKSIKGWVTRRELGKIEETNKKIIETRIQRYGRSHNMKKAWATRKQRGVVEKQIKELVAKRRLQRSDSDAIKKGWEARYAKYGPTGRKASMRSTRKLAAVSETSDLEQE